jgi:hypothetical protein
MLAMVPGWVVDFCGLIFWGGKVRFCGRFWGKVVFRGWFFVVSLWFLGGETWEVDGSFSRLGNVTLF